MPSNTSIDFVNLDFNTLKASVLTYLKSQAQFKDYDFSGSDINLLIDLMTKYTERQAFYVNMMMAEGFLDSAQMTASVWSKAKQLNYVPRSPRSPVATVQVSFTATGDSAPYIIPKGSSFNTLIKNQSYVYSIPEAVIVASSNTQFSFTTDIYEGVYVKDSYVFQSDDTTPYPTLKITNPSVDTTSLTVAVYEDGAVNPDVYTQTTTLLGLNSNSQVYFLQTSVDGYYEVQFGDGNLGYMPKNGATVLLDYRVTTAANSNGSTNFSMNFDPTTNPSELTSTPVITTISTGSGGAGPESLDSVRYYAPRSFQVQDRAVTANDYKILLQQNFPEIEAINVYGGQEETPPLYGRVIISMQIAGINGVPASLISKYGTFLSNKGLLTTSVVFRDPQFTYLQVNSLVRYSTALTPATPNFISLVVTNVINQYANQNLNDFNVQLRASQLSQAIQNADPSIISNITNYSIYKKVTPALNGVPQNLVLSFSTPLATFQESVSTLTTQSAVTTSSFTLAGQSVVIKDDGQGNLYNMTPQSNGSYKQVSSAGTVDYTSGTVTLVNFNPSDYDGDVFQVFVTPADPDISSAQLNILEVEPAGIIVTAQPISGNS